MIDLSWGHPEYLKEYWETSNDYAGFSFDILSRYSLGSGLDILRDSIGNLHAEEGNHRVGSKHIVIGNGATQLIRGLLHCLGGKTVTYSSPHYSMIPTLAKNAGYTFEGEAQADVGIVVNPINPTGELDKSTINAKHVIHDAVYNWSQYGPTIPNFDEPIMVNSMSKAFGHPGLRVGWAMIEDDDLAQRLTNFIREDTSGVSSVSQLMAVNVISKQLAKTKKQRCFYYGRYELKYRWALLKRTLGATEGIESLNRLGMFALLKVDAPDAHAFMLQKYGVMTVPGPNMGLASNIVRVNIGSAIEDFEKFISRLSENTKYEDIKS